MAVYWSAVQLVKLLGWDIGQKMSELQQLQEVCDRCVEQGKNDAMDFSGLSSGVVFGRDFRVVRALRAGGMGAVYVVDQLSTGKQRALKVLAPEFAADSATRERFVFEARAASRIESDHVVEIVSAGVDEETGAPYLVMELLRGEELADALLRIGPLPTIDVVEILNQIGHALEQAHAQGIVHRDLKPENVFLAVGRRRDSRFTAKILDFGIAKLVENAHKTGTQPLGTPLFMAPEQTDSKGRISPATDVWALGLLAFRLLTGKDFWLEADGSLASLLREIVIAPIPPASVRAKELGVEHLLPADFDRWFAQCVNRNDAARFPEAGEAVRAFVALAPAGTEASKLSVHPGALLAGLPSSSPEAGGDRYAISGGVKGMTESPFIAGAPRTATNSNSVSKWIAPGILGGVLLIGATVALRSLDRPEHQDSGAVVAQALSAAVDPRLTPGHAVSHCPASMVFIPGGKMFMGARDLTEDAKPPHEVSVSSFCLDKTEVRTSDYLECVKKGECERPADVVSWPRITEAQRKRYSPLCNAGKEQNGTHPINCVAWAMADNYCRKHEARLPTEAEWEYAARGPVQRRYPWGDEAPNATRLNACGTECAQWGDSNGDPREPMYAEHDGFAGTAPVGSFQAGASSHGVLDLAGNVWEWTGDYYAPYLSEPQADPKGPPAGTQRVLRGGDFFSSKAEWARPAYRWKTDPETANHAIGFRCARAPSL